MVPRAGLLGFVAGLALVAVPLLATGPKLAGPGTRGDVPASAFLTGSAGPPQAGPPLAARPVRGLAELAAYRRLVRRPSLVVRFRPGVPRAERLRLRAGYGKPTTSIPELRLEVVRVPRLRLSATLSALRSSSAVAAVSRDRVRAAAGTPNDPEYPSRCALPQIGWDSAFASVKPKRRVTIAVLDTGVDASHPDLASPVTRGYSVFPGSSPRVDPNGHGTRVASIAAATAGNGVGIAGIAYGPARIMPVQVLDRHGLARDSGIVKGVLWAADHSANVILMSLAGPGYSPALPRAVSYAWSKGAVVVAAAGNAGSSAPTYPAGDAKVVGATTAPTPSWPRRASTSPPTFPAGAPAP